MPNSEELVATSVVPLERYYAGLAESAHVTKWVGSLAASRLQQALDEQRGFGIAEFEGLGPSGYGMMVHLLVADLEVGVHENGQPLSADESRLAAVALRDKAGLYLGTIKAARAAYGDEFGSAVHDWLVKAFQVADDDSEQPPSQN